MPPARPLKALRLTQQQRTNRRQKLSCAVSLGSCRIVWPISAAGSMFMAPRNGRWRIGRSGPARRTQLDRQVVEDRVERRFQTEAAGKSMEFDSAGFPPNLFSLEALPRVYGEDPSRPSLTIPLSMEGPRSAIRIVLVATLRLWAAPAGQPPPPRRVVLHLQHHQWRMLRRARLGWLLAGQDCLGA